MAAVRSKNTFKRRQALLTLLSALVLLFPLAAFAQDKETDNRARPGPGPNAVRLTIVVTGGEEKKPVDSASVYVRIVEGRKLAKDKKIEMDLKTNTSGVCHVPDIPRGKVLIQVIAPGWKTFGEYYSPDQAEQTIDINLQQPPKWY